MARTPLKKSACAIGAGPVQSFLALTLLIAAHAGVAIAKDVPLPPLRPIPYADSPAPAEHASKATEPSECRTHLQTIAEITPVAAMKGPGGCGGDDMVRLEAMRLADQSRIAVTPPPILRCSMATALTDWIRDDVAASVATLGGKLRSLDNFGDYECRGRNRIAGAKLSEHGKGNAIDIRGFSLDSGRTIRLTDVTVSADFRKALRASACARFTTVLGPGSDGFHNSHIHLDLAERHNDYRICEWDLNSPPSSPAGVEAANIPLPLPKPEVLRR
ncbi:MAG TPA: extensin family protein [Pseudolabrys sp.]|nr:extensin family protein [Pseudolabrys sp.]